MGNFELFQLANQIRESPEFQRLQQLNRFSNSLRIFEANYQELERLLWFICESSAGKQLFQRDNRAAWEQAIEEVVRLLQNFAASVLALVDHSRVLYKRLYKSSGTFADYESEVKSRFETNPIIQFVHGLRHYCLHHGVPNVGTTMTLVDIKNEQFEIRVTIRKLDLLDFDWTATAKTFLMNSSDHIDVRSVLRDYHTAVEDFYNWFSRRVRQIHASDYDCVSSHYDAILKGKAEQYATSLEGRVRAYESGIGTPFDVLNPFMTPSETAELYPLWGDVEKWLRVAGDKVATRISSGKDAARRVLEAFKRSQHANTILASSREG